MAITVAKVLADARLLLIDEDAVRWTDPELLTWLNAAQRDAVIHKPDANAVTAELTCAIGTKQSIPAGGLQLLDVVRNTIGTKRAVRAISRAVLDAELPTWHSQSATNAVTNFMFDDRNPTTFYVYPPASDSAKLEIVYSATPVDVELADDIALPDVYAGALTDYVVYRALLKDAHFAANRDRAMLHFGQYMTTLTGKQTAEVMEAPRREFSRTAPPSPTPTSA